MNTRPPAHRARRSNRRRLGAVAVAFALGAAACGSGDDPGIAQSGVTDSSADDGAATEDSAPAATVDLVASSGIDGEDPDFNLSALVWQGYWLSRDHFGPFVMGSGAGIPFEPPMEMMQAAMGMVAQNPDDPVAIPANLFPLQAVYASADPTLVNDPREFDPLDFEGLRLDPTSFDETVRVRAQAETMLKESQWAHNFADPHFGTPDGDFGAQQRFMGQMVALLSVMQGQYAMGNLATDSGLYADSDGTIDHTGNWVLLHTFADIASLTGGDAANGRYANPEAAPAFANATAGLLEALDGREPETPDEAASAIRALVYVAATHDDLGDAARERLATIADALAEMEAESVADRGAALAGLVAAGAATGEDDHLAAADEALQALAADFDPTTGVFGSTDTYTVDDVAWVIGGLNSALQQGVESSRPEAGRMLVAFYEATLSLGGMQLSAPPGKDGAMAGEFEKDLPHENYYHPVNTPPPPMAGYLTVPAEEITLGADGWSVSSDRFVVAGAMHLANELNWLGPHLGSIPFPLTDSTDVTDDSAEQSASGTSSEVTINAEDIAFDLEQIDATAGEELTITFNNNDTDVPHNIHVQAGTVDEKTEITPGPDTQTLRVTIDDPGSYTFICDVHPNMTGEVVVS